MEVFGDDGSGEGGGVTAEFAAGVDRGVDAGVDAVADDRAEFAATGVDELARDGGAVVGAIMAEV